MPNPYGAPEITVIEAAASLENDVNFSLVDVREPNELAMVKINDEKVITLPLSKLAKDGEKAVPVSLMDKKRSIGFICHHGMRSAQVTMWFQQNGWENVVSVAGGVNAYAMQVDPEIGRY